jgi:hypothetical protein
MSQILNTVAVIGIDIGKNSFHVAEHCKAWQGKCE